MLHYLFAIIMIALKMIKSNNVGREKSKKVVYCITASS